MGSVDLRLGDCLEIMKGIPSESIDLCLTDPPYGVLEGFSWDNKQYFQSSIKAWMREMLRVVTLGGGMVIFCAEKYLPLILEGERFFQRLLIWDKKCGVGSANNGIWYSTEIMAVFNKGELDRKGIKDFQMSIFSVKKERLNYQYGHPTQKPAQLMNWLINHYSNVDDTILDPFMGSGTTGVACQELGRNFIGIEINEKYFKIAERRINQATKELFV